MKTGFNFFNKSRGGVFLKAFRLSRNKNKCSTLPTTKLDRELFLFFSLTECQEVNLFSGTNFFCSSFYPAYLAYHILPLFPGLITFSGSHGLGCPVNLAKNCLQVFENRYPLVSFSIWILFRIVDEIIFPKSSSSYQIWNWLSPNTFDSLNLMISRIRLWQWKLYTVQ